MPTKLAENHIELPAGTTAQRPTPSIGMFRYNTDTGKKVPEYYNGTVWVGLGIRDGLTKETAAYSGFDLKNNYPSSASGTYWIKGPQMTKAVQMYVDMTQDSGGYDFYAFQGTGRQTQRVNGNHSGRDLGLELWIPRSKNCWIAAINYVRNVLGESAGANTDRYFQSIPVFRTNSDWNTLGGDTKNYTAYIIRDPLFYGTGVPDWTVVGGGRWWLRDTAMPAEPSGDYNNFMFLSNVGYGITSVNNPYTGQDISFNDGAFQSIAGAGFTLGTYYLVSTNAKP
jgi:hypothetical protein